jgi:hypothetical protein
MPANSANVPRAVSHEPNGAIPDNNQDPRKISQPIAATCTAGAENHPTDGTVDTLSPYTFKPAAVRSRRPRTTRIAAIARALQSIIGLPPGDLSMDTYRSRLGEYQRVVLRKNCVFHPQGIRGIGDVNDKCSLGFIFHFLPTWGEDEPEG